MTNMSPVAERFLRYVRIDTQSDRNSLTVPSTAKQKDLGRLLREELIELGAREVVMDEHGYVYATVPASAALEESPTVALFAHVDTSPDEPGGPVNPQVHRNYDGGDLELGHGVVLSPSRSPALAKHIGHDIITSDGSTLLGSDDKAGVAIIMQLVEDLLGSDTLARPRVRVCFTVDEEIGRGVDHLDLDLLGADIGYTIDGGAIGEVDAETFNAAEARITVDGLMVHPGTAKGVMVNALSIMAEILAALPAAEAPETTSGGEGYFCAHSMAGSIQRAEASLLLRDFQGAGLERRKQLVSGLAAVAGVKHPAASVKVDFEESYANMGPFITQLDRRAIDVALEAGRDLEIRMTEAKVRGGTDGARLSELGLPTPNLFTGGHDYHSRFEWNTVQNLEHSLTFAKAVVAKWASLPALSRGNRQAS